MNWEERGVVKCRPSRHCIIPLQLGRTTSRNLKKSVRYKYGTAGWTPGRVLGVKIFESHKNLYIIIIMIIHRIVGFPDCQDLG